MQSKAGGNSSKSCSDSLTFIAYSFLRAIFLKLLVYHSTNMLSLGRSPAEHKNSLSCRVSIYPLIFAVFYRTFKRFNDKMIQFFRWMMSGPDKKCSVLQERKKDTSYSFTQRLNTVEGRTSFRLCNIIEAARIPLCQMFLLGRSSAEHKNSLSQVRRAQIHRST